MSSVEDRSLALKVGNAGNCPCLSRGDLVVLKGSSIDLCRSTAVCVEPLCEIFPVIRGLLRGGAPGAPLPALAFPCPVQGCGATLQLVAPPATEETMPASRELPPLHAPEAPAPNSTIGNDDVPFLARLSSEDQKDLLSKAQPQYYEPGEVLLEKGVIGDSLIILARGEVEVFLPGQGGQEDAVVKTLRWGECVGELSLLTEQPTTASIRARTPCKTLVIDKERFEQLYFSRPSLNRAFTRMLYERFRKANKVVSDERRASYKGKLKAVGLPHLLQSLNQARRTGVLRVHNGHQVACMGFQEGRPTSAVLLDVTLVGDDQCFDPEVLGGLEPVVGGLDAFYQVFPWNEGVFRFQDGASESRGALESDLMSLLMESARRLDEGS